MEDPNDFFNWFFKRIIYDFFKAAIRTGLQQFSKKKYLNYDIKWLIEQYKREKPISPLIPYSEIANFLTPSPAMTPAILARIPGQFNLGNDDSGFIEAFQGEALGSLIRDGKVTANDEVIRLTSTGSERGKTVLNIQKAEYFDQGKSNLVMDWEGPHTLSLSGNCKTLRNYLSAKYQKFLPPLDEQLLANTIGISVIILYKEGRKLLPYMPQRVGDTFKDILQKTGRSPKKVAVFEGGFHCTASGAAEWAKKHKFESLFIEDLYRELKDEVGLEKEHIDILKPVALCREFLRAGKPQIFCVGITDRTRDELRELRRKAIERTLQCKMPPEIHDKMYLWSDAGEAKEMISKEGVTIEAGANLFYVDKFLSSIT